MKQEDKELLLKDLSARLPYRVKVDIGINKIITGFEFHTTTLIGEHIDDYINYVIDIIRPYLRPMSSMTEEEEREYHNLCYEEERNESEYGEWATRVYFRDTIESIDYLNSIHIDYRGLIPKGLALKAPEGMYKEE